MPGPFTFPDQQIRDLPDPPARLWPLIGPGVVAAGVGLASGEFILWPYIASQVGLVLLWGAAMGIITQWFINMEIERYTLATGETAITGFIRMWRHWGLVFALMVYFGNLWPGWATSSATMLTYLVGGNPVMIAIGMLIAIGAALTLAPVVYVMLERVQFVKIAAVVAFIVLAAFLVISRDAWAHLPQGLMNVGHIPSQLGFALVMGAFAFAGAGGGQNLCQSNWIRDKGFGMGAYVPRLVSPVTGEKVAANAPVSYSFEPNAENMSRWRGWWRLANIEQAVTFALISLVTIIFTSMIAYSTVYGHGDVPQNVDFIRIQGEQMRAHVGAGFDVLDWSIGTLSLFAAAMGIVDFTCRIGADVLKCAYLRESKWTENRLYFVLVWGLVACGCAVLLLGVRQPLVLLIISSCVGGLMMCIYSLLLILLNRSRLPAAIRITPLRIAVLMWATALFGFLAVLTIKQQLQNL
ncbi:MAG: Nramp family divalent metal transporter [Povalibacter sp.]